MKEPELDTDMHKGMTRVYNLLQYLEQFRKQEWGISIVSKIMMVKATLLENIFL